MAVKITYMQTIGSRIKELRRERKLTQAEVGAKTGVSGVAVGHWEKDMHTPKGETLTKLAKLLRTTPDYIISGKKPRPTERHDYEIAETPAIYEVLIKEFDRVPDDMKAAAIKMIQALHQSDSQNNNE